MSWTRKDDDALFEFHQEVGNSRADYNRLTRGWSDKRKRQELDDFRRQRTQLEQRKAKIIEGVRILKLARSSQPDNDTTLLRVQVKLSKKHWHDLETEASLDSEVFIVHSEKITVVSKFQDPDSGEHEKRVAQYEAGGVELLESGLSEPMQEALDEDIVKDFDRYLRRTSAVGYPPVSAAISRVVYPAMIAKLNVIPAPSVPGLEKRSVYLTAPEIRYLSRKGPKSMSAVLRTLLDKQLSA
jgi:hypothetical protein